MQEPKPILVLYVLVQDAGYLGLANKLKNLSFRVSARNLALKFLYLKETEKK